MGGRPQGRKLIITTSTSPPSLPPQPEAQPPAAQRPKAQLPEAQPPEVLSVATDDPDQVIGVIGTAGHVDHGKTTLVAALTGIDTDRLAEEKRRGISIELGFAWMASPRGRVALIDVPGHERFVRQMIAGAAGIDAVLLVIAADEGVMPQTREHLDICALLGIKRGLVVLSKVDLVDAEWLELVRDDLADSLVGTFLEGAPILPWSRDDPATTQAVRSAAVTLIRGGSDTAAGALHSGAADRPFKLSVDRAFTMRGFGTVVTGTSVSGRLELGSDVVLLPSEIRSRVRGIEQHGAAVQSVGPRVRVALNLQGVELEQVHRGDVVCRPGTLSAASMIDASFACLERIAAPVADRSKVLVHLGTSQIEGTLAFVGADEAIPGQTVCAQLRLAQPAAFLPGEPYIVRGFAIQQGYGKTLGGGRALAASNRRYRRNDSLAFDSISALAGDDPRAGVAAWVALARDAGRRASAAACALPWNDKEVAAAISACVSDGSIFATSSGAGVLVARETVTRLAARAVMLLGDYHAAHPAQSGIAADALRSQLRGDLGGPLFETILQWLLDEGQVRRSPQSVALAGHTPRRSRAQEAAIEAVAEALRGGGLTPPRVVDLPEACGLAASEVQAAVAFLVDDEEVVRVSRELVFAAPAVQALRAAVLAHFEAEETMNTAAFKALTGASRKWTIPLGEYLDRQGVTVRAGDVRRRRAVMT